MLDKIITAKAESMSVALHGLPETFPWALLTALMASISYRTGAGRGITEHSKACCMRAGWSHALFLYPRSKDLDVLLCPHGIAHCIQTYWLRCGWILVARLQTEFLYPWSLPRLVCVLLSIVLTHFCGYLGTEWENWSTLTMTKRFLFKITSTASQMPLDFFEIWDLFNRW